MAIDPRETTLEPGKYYAYPSGGNSDGLLTGEEEHTVVFRAPDKSPPPPTAITTPTPITVPQQVAIKVHITPIAMFPKPVDLTPDSNWQKNSFGTSYTGTAWLSKSLWTNITPYISIPNISAHGWSWSTSPENCRLMAPDGTGVTFIIYNDNSSGLTTPDIINDPPLPFAWNELNILKLRVTLRGVMFLPVMDIAVHFIVNGVKYRFFNEAYSAPSDEYLSHVDELPLGTMVPFRGGYAYTIDDPDFGRTGMYIFEMYKEPIGTIHSWPDGYGGYYTSNSNNDNMSILQNGLMTYVYDGDQGPNIEKLEIWTA